jgi:hypothetical protein
VTAGLDGCQSYTFTNKGSTVTVSLGAMSFPAYGTDSSAYTATFTVSGIDASVGFVLARTGDALALVQVADVGSVDVSQLENSRAWLWLK